MLKTDKPIIIENTFRCSAEKLWSALTDINEMHQWYFQNIPEFRPEVGFKTKFEVRSEDRIFTHNWEIAAVEPFKELAYSWKFDEYVGISVSTFYLEVQKEGVRLTLKIDVLEDFEQGIQEFERESCVGGWSYFLDGNLRKYLES